MARLTRVELDQRLSDDVLTYAPALMLLTGMSGSWMDQLARQLGYSTRKISNTFPSKSQVIEYILRRHLDDAFEAVCVPSDWDGPPPDVLRAMSLALIGYFTDNLPRHRVFLAERDHRSDRARGAMAQQVIYLTNNFQVALHTVTPGCTFDSLRVPAELLLGQLTHAPLWWPAGVEAGGSATTLDAWVCTQIGLLAGIKRPDHRRPVRAIRKL